MRILFIGQAPFGRESLEALLAQNEEIAGVITVEDPPKPRYPNPVKACAVENGIELYQANYLKKPEIIAWVRNLQPDLLVLAFVTSFVPKEMIELAPRGGINYHPSLLPKYRGGSAINWAIINGETETGVTIHYIDEGVDTGPILLQESVTIDPHDTVKAVYFEKLYPLGITMIAQAVREIREGSATASPQDESLASFQPVITKDDTVIDWSRTTHELYNLLRGANPSPGAVTTINGQPCILFDAAIVDSSGIPGTIIHLGESGFTVATGDGAIEIRSAQIPGNRKQPAHECATEIGITVGSQLGS